MTRLGESCVAQPRQPTYSPVDQTIPVFVTKEHPNRDMESSDMTQGNDLFDIIHTTRAMRRLKPDPVPDELVQRILEAGTCAPTKGDEPTLLCGMTRMTSMNPGPGPGRLFGILGLWLFFPPWIPAVVETSSVVELLPWV